MRIHQNSSLCILLYLLFASILTLWAAENSTSTEDPIFLACGTTGVFFDDDKEVNWIGDNNSTYAPSLNSLGLPINQQDPSVPRYPFSTVRLFTSPYTYQFTLSPGRKFIRLYFYPTNYATHSASDALINVTAGAITLLSNFSAYQTVQVLYHSYVVREFSVNVTTGFLNLTFSPSTTHPKAYAFINGIEIVSIPDIFDILNTWKIPTLINEGNPIVYPIEPDRGLETVFRLNVGGQSISGKDDSDNLFRSWEDDSKYIYDAGFGVSYAKDENVTIKYTSIVPEYIAPENVYATARSMGPTPQINLNYNLTWILTVDAGFYYLVRLHFCEIHYQFTKVNQRVFYIYLNNQTAVERADIIDWSGGIGIPIYQDYVVMTSGSGQMDLWVELHPNLETKTEYFDAILNGLEVFKLDSGGSLAGPNPVLQPIQFSPPSSIFEQSRRGKSKISTIVGGTAGGIAAILLLGLFLVVMCIHRKKKMKEAIISNGPSGWLPLSDYKNSQSNPSPKTSTTLSQGSPLPTNICRHFTIAEIKAATNDFHESLLLGVGGFGKVYLGEIDGVTKVAIKRANPTSEQGVHEFRTEIEMLSKLRHKHLVSLIGYCKENNEMILVYDYMANGTLREHLYGTDKPALTWKQRLDICIGAARGLHYLHTGVKHSIFHHDVKSTNILIDEHFVAKVSDFGVSKVDASISTTHTHVSSVVEGSFGYLDPEYLRRLLYTEKSDVYSFGIVLFEVLCARPALNPSKEQASLADWALQCQRRGIIDQIIDPYLKGKIASQCLRKFSETAEKCLAETGLERPSMGNVLWNLEFALQLQQSAEDVGSFVATTDGSPLSVRAERSTTDSPFLKSTTLTTTTSTSIEGRSVASGDSTNLNPSAVFSQILNPVGR